MHTTNTPATPPAMGGSADFAASVNGMPVPAPWEGQRQVVALDDGFIGAVANGAQVRYSERGNVVTGQYSTTDGGAWVVMDAAGAEVQRQPLVAEMLPLMLRNLQSPELATPARLLDSVSSMGLLALVAQLQEASASATAPGLGALERLALVAKVQEISAQIMAATGSAPAAAAPVAHTDEHGHTYTVMQDPKALYRVMSPEEWDSIVATGSITGGGSSFNSDEGRGDVFFADKLDATLLSQGNDTSRRLAFQLRKDGADTSLQQAQEQEQIALKDYHSSVGTAQSAALRRLKNVRQMITSLEAGVKKAGAEKAKQLSAIDAERGYSMVVIETKPVAGGKVYEGKHSNYAGTEYGFEPGQLRLSDVAHVTFYADGQPVKNQDAQTAADESSAYQNRPEASLTLLQAGAMKKLQALPGAGLSLDAYADQLFEIWMPVGEEALDNQQEREQIPEPLAKALSAAIEGFLQVEKTTYENI